MLKKLLLALPAIVLLLGVVVQPAHAEPIEVTSNRESVTSNIKTDGTSQNYYTYSLVDMIQVNFLWATAGGKPVETNQGGSIDGEKKVTYTRGLIGDTAHYIAMLYQNPPANTQTYVADLLNSSGIKIAQPVHAQGLGFASLNPILNTWKTFRNVAYLFFVVIFLVIGFMIMLRQKIGGQTVVTAQQAIPHIIVALLFVTFSYAIAGLLIDAMYLSMYLLLALFGQNNTELINYNFLTLGIKLVFSGFSTGLEAVSNFLQPLENSLAQVGQDIIAFIPGLTLALIFSIAIALNVFKLFFELLKTYVTIVLTITFSPIILMMGAIPGKNPFGNWVKSLVGNLIVFPTILLVLIVYERLTSSSVEIGGFLPPYLYGGVLGSQGKAGILPFLVGLGMILILPEIVNKVKTTIAPSGVFEQLAGDVGSAFKAGWKGGELVPGLGFTDTNKLPILKQMGGLSGENIARKQGIALGALAGLPVGGVEYGIKQARMGQGSPGRGKGRLKARNVILSRMGKAAQFVGTQTGDEQIKQSESENKS